MAGFDKQVETLDGLHDKVVLSAQEQAALEVAAECMDFCAALWEAMGEDVEQTPDLSKMENLYDAYQGELAAAALFLSEDAFSRAPDMLRVVSERLLTAEDKSVPVVVAKGFSRFAKRIEHTRQLQQNVIRQLDKKSTEQ